MFQFIIFSFLFIFIEVHSASAKMLSEMNLSDPMPLKQRNEPVRVFVIDEFGVVKHPPWNFEILRHKGDKNQPKRIIEMNFPKGSHIKFRQDVKDKLEPSYTEHTTGVLRFPFEEDSLLLPFEYEQAIDDKNLRRKNTLLVYQVIPRRLASSTVEQIKKLETKVFEAETVEEVKVVKSILERVIWDFSAYTSQLQYSHTPYDLKMSQSSLVLLGGAEFQLIENKIHLGGSLSFVPQVLSYKLESNFYQKEAVQAYSLDAYLSYYFYKPSPLTQLRVNGGASSWSVASLSSSYGFTNLISPELGFTLQTHLVNRDFYALISYSPIGSYKEVLKNKRIKLGVGGELFKFKGAKGFMDLKYSSFGYKGLLTTGEVFKIGINIFEIGLSVLF